MIELDLIIALKETFIMVSIPMICALIFSIPIGAILFLTHKNGLKPNKYLYTVFNLFVNLVRSFPYIIFVVVLIPVTRFFIGTGFGVYASAFPMCFVAVAIFSRFVEQSFYDVNYGILDLAKSLKATNFQLIYNFLLVESRQSLVLGFTSTIISMISYSTVMGIVGGGGIGDYAMQHGYYSFDYLVTFKAVIIMIIIVFFIQFLGNKIAYILDKKRREK